MLNYMSNSFLCFIIISWILPIFSTTNGQQLYPEVTNGGRSHYPGVRLTLTSAGIDRISEAVCNAVERSTENMPLQSIDISFLLVSQISFSDMRISQYRVTNGGQCRVITKTPNKFVLTIQNVDMVIKAMVSGGLLIFNTAYSDYTARLNGVSYEIGVSLGRYRGYPRFKFLGCRAKISHATQSMQGGAGVVRRALNTLQGQLTRSFQRHLEAQLTNSYRNVIRAVNGEIEKFMPHQMSLWSARSLYYGNDAAGLSLTNQNSAGRRGTRFSTNQNTAAATAAGKNLAQMGNSVMSKIENGMKNLRMDNALIQNPVVTKSGSVTMEMKGEISWLGHGRTPFYPNSLDLHDEHANGHNGWYRSKGGKMVQVILSDYVLNSMLYHAHRNGILHLRIGPKENWQLAKTLFQRQCPDLMCLGEHLPQIYDYYRQDSLEMALEFTKAPAAVIRSDKISMQLDGHVTLHGQDLNAVRAGASAKSIEIVKVRFDAQAAIKLTVASNHHSETLNATVIVQRVKTNMIRKSINRLLAERDIDDLITFGRPLIEYMMVQPFSDGGIPIPRTKYGKLRNLRIDLRDRRLSIDSDLDLNAYEFVNFAKKVLKSG